MQKDNDHREASQQEGRRDEGSSGLTTQLEDQLEKLRVDLIRQEHRGLAVAKNFIETHRLGTDHPRFRAAFLAACTYFFWRAPVRAVFTLGGLAALVSAYFLYQQTESLQQQNLILRQELETNREVAAENLGLISQQNQLIRQQIDLMALERRDVQNLRGRRDQSDNGSHEEGEPREPTLPTEGP